jgi:hypothetical protein
MDEDAVLLALGNLQGEMRGYNTRMDGLGREIGEIKDALKCKSEDCSTCRKEIDGEIAQTQASIATVKDTHTGEAAVRTWWDSNITKGGIILGIVIGIIGFFRGS